MEKDIHSDKDVRMSMLDNEASLVVFSGGAVLWEASFKRGGLGSRRPAVS